MNENLSAALQITLVGMTFVLAALAVLSLAMAALVRLTAEPPPETRTPAPLPAQPAARAPSLSRHAAAVAVAVAVARTLGQPQAAGTPTARLVPPPPTSPWQATMRARNLKQRERRR